MHNNINYIANRNHSKQYIFYPFYLRCQFEFQTDTPINVNFTEQWLKSSSFKMFYFYKAIRSNRCTIDIRYFSPYYPNTYKYRIVRYKVFIIYFYAWIHHIWHFNMLKKLLCIVTLCVRRFISMVWLMYFLFNRDIELFCDKCVVHWYGEPVLCCL